MTERHVRMRYVDHCGSCGGVIVTFHRAKTARLFRGCDCSPECEHPHAPAAFDMSYAVNGTPWLWHRRPPTQTEQPTEERDRDAT